MSRTINLPSEETIVLITQKEESLTTNKISVDTVIDNGESVKATVSFFSSTGITKSLILWDAESTPTYQAIGQWTDTDVENRIKEIYP